MTAEARHITNGEARRQNLHLLDEWLEARVVHRSKLRAGLPSTPPPKPKYLPEPAAYFDDPILREHQKDAAKRGAVVRRFGSVIRVY